MGTYRQPERIIDPSTAIINQSIKDFDNQVNQLFSELSTDHKKQQSANYKLKNKNQVDKLKGRKEWQASIKRAKPKKGFSQEMMRQLREWGDEYYSLYGSTDKADLDRMDELLSYPEQLGQAQGVIMANTQPYMAAYNIQDPDGANALNYDTSWDAGLAIMYDVTQNNGDNFKLTEVRGTGGAASQLIWELDDGQGHSYQINNNELVKYSQTGELLFDVNGDIDAVMLPYMNGVTGNTGWKDIIDYDRGLKVIDQQGNIEITSKLYEEKNEELKTEAYNSDMSATLNNQKLMSSIWPQLIRWAEKNQPELLYGPDKQVGTADDLVTIDPATNRPQMWFGGSMNNILKQQQEVAKSIMIERMFDPALAGIYGIKQDVVVSEIEKRKRTSGSKKDDKRDEFTTVVQDANIDYSNIDPLIIIDILNGSLPGDAKEADKFYTVDEVLDKIGTKAFTDQAELDKWKEDNKDRIFHGLSKNGQLHLKKYWDEDALIQTMLDNQ